MNIYLTRHGETRYNKQKLMQGLTDEPLNETGRKQALSKAHLLKDIVFDAVYVSPLIRTKETASLITSKDLNELITDKRLIETDFGKYELKPYYLLGPKMTLYWMFPELFKHSPDTVEDKSSMIKRAESFLKELEEKDYKNVLIVCHGGIIRALTGYLEDRENGLKWRPKPKNAEIRVYETDNHKHRYIKTI